jgi:hypothetical protein
MQPSGLTFKYRVDAELRQRDAAWQGYTAGRTDAQIQAQIAADPAVIGTERIAREVPRPAARTRGTTRTGH